MSITPETHPPGSVFVRLAAAYGGGEVTIAERVTIKKWTPSGKVRLSNGKLCSVHEKTWNDECELRQDDWTSWRPLTDELKKRCEEGAAYNDTRYLLSILADGIHRVSSRQSIESMKTARGQAIALAKTLGIDLKISE